MAQHPIWLSAQSCLERVCGTLFFFFFNLKWFISIITTLQSPNSLQENHVCRYFICEQQHGRKKQKTWSASSCSWILQGSCLSVFYFRSVFSVYSSSTDLIRPWKVMVWYHELIDLFFEWFKPGTRGSQSKIVIYSQSFDIIFLSCSQKKIISNFQLLCQLHLIKITILHSLAFPL
jgi:hypothetical protein